MHPKDNIIKLNRILTPWMLVKELLLNLGNVLECDIVGRVREKASYVEGNVVKVEAHN